MMTFENLFWMGLDRNLPSLLAHPPSRGHVVGLGEGSNAKKRIGLISLGLPEWRWPNDPLPFKENSVAIYHAYHFLEHLTGEDAIELLIAIERTLVPGGILQFCIPWAKAEIGSMDLTHKSFWTESSFRTLFDNHYYQQRPWKLRLHYQVLAGIVERNICLLGQVVKSEE